MSTIILIRPGCTDFDDQHRIQGSLELPLNKRGHQQVTGIIEELENVELDLIYSAPTEPSISTAQAVSEALDVPLKETERLCNLDQGLWEGMTLEEIERKFPKIFKRWHESPEDICPPQGEPVAEALARIHKMLQKPKKKGYSFAIVASEPLATLIACIVRGVKFETIPQPLCGCESPLHIEYLVRNGVTEVAMKHAVPVPRY